MKTFKKHLLSTEQHGFALISTLSIMALLVMLAIGMMSLATTESKVADATKYEMEAKANARMALMIALGELQEEVGPDQRITGNASIFANDSGGNEPSRASFDATSIDSNFENPHLLGVWDSWKTWLSGDSDPSEIAATYDRGRTQNFRRYLVSHPDSENLSPQQWRSIAEGGYGGIETVDLVNKVLGDNPSDSDIVKAPIVETPNGGYAWHVSGNNQKTNVSLGKEDRDTEVAGSAAELANLTSHGLDGSIDSSLNNYPVEAEDTEKAISLQTSTLVDSNATDFLKTHYQENYHAYTADSQSILADVRKGGLKKDLNAYLERDLDASVSSGGSLEDSWGINANNPDLDAPVTIRETSNQPGYLGNPTYTFPATGNPNLPSWYKLHQYYQAYKGQSGSLDEDGSTQPGVTQTKGAGYTNKKPSLVFNTHNANMFQRGYTRTPLASRIIIQLGARQSVVANGRDAGKTEFLVVMNPVLYLWNPYNVPLEVPRTVTMVTFGKSLQYRLTQGSNEIVPWSDIGGQFNLMQLYTNNATGVQNFNSLTLAPGESRLFSVNLGDDIANAIDKRIHMSPGHTQDHFGRVRRVALQDPNNPSNGFIPGDTTEIHFRFTGAEFSAKETHNFFWGMGRDNGVVGGNSNAIPTVRFGEMGMRTLPKAGFINLTEPGGKAVQVEPDPFASTAEFFVNFGFSFKGGDFLNPNDGLNLSPTAGEDYRAKNFVLASPTNLRSQVSQETSRQLALGSYEFFAKRGSGSILNFDTQDTRAYSFSSFEQSGAVYDGQLNVPLLEMPLSPAYSLASLQHFRLEPGGTVNNAPGLNGGRGFHLFEVSASNFGLGIGNAYAHPMIDADDIYGFAIDGRPDPRNPNQGGFGDGQGANGNPALQRKLNVDVWDHLFLQNDALYDSWFTSSLTQQNTDTFQTRRTLGQVFTEFVNGSEPLPNQHLEFDQGAETVATIQAKLFNGADFTEEAHKELSKYLLLQGGFNVNSTSVEAWKGLFRGLRTDVFQYLPPSAPYSVTTHTLNDPQVVISRYTLPNSPNEVTTSGGANDSDAWTGVRYLTEAQINKLAEECVRQVKLRGPFLNMSDFVNRRLDANDNETSRVGALQAAIDWDEYNGNAPQNNSESINGRFKKTADMITNANSVGTWNSPGIDNQGTTLPFAEAFYGSRWTGIPGYVMQGDLLKRIGNQITVRDDTFTIRAYGESKDAQGNVKAKVVCEAVVQRTPRYVNHKDTGNPGVDGATPETQFDDLATNDDTNRRYGRKMVIKSFRWLSDKEI